MIIKLFRYFNLQNELNDYEEIHNNIESDSTFRGTNLWILMFAILVASVGLNMNSTAVIIGAMLISPLMGPINGMGYSVATYNFELLRKSIKHFTFAVIVSLLTSTAYFAISPVSTAQSELLARTSPTIYDVFIALFGGMAGIIAISSKKKGNVIPGVAIATALMPPLCTAGYGLATFQMNFFFGAIYLFTINTVFIGISSVIVSQILKFPIRSSIDTNHKRKINRIVWGLILITALPSIYFGYKLVENERFIQNSNKFINTINIIDGSYLLKSEIDENNKTIKLVYGGNILSDETKAKIKKNLFSFGLEKAKIIFEQGFSFEEMSNTLNQYDRYSAEINKLKAIIQDKDKTIDSIITRKEIGKELITEIKSFYPEIISLAFGETTFFDEINKQKNYYLILKTNDNKKIAKDVPKIETWLKTRFKLDSSKVNVFLID